MPVGNGSRTRKCVRPVVSNQAVYGCGPESFLLCNSGRYGEICLQAIPHAEWGIWGISPPVLILHVGRLLPETLTPGHFWSAALGTRAESLVLVDHVAWDVLGRHDGCRTCMESRGEEDPQRSCWVPVGPCGITCKVIALSGSNQFNSFEFTNEVMRLYCPWGSASLASPNTAALTPAPASAASISPANLCSMFLDTQWASPPEEEHLKLNFSWIVFSPKSIFFSFPSELSQRHHYSSTVST